MAESDLEAYFDKIDWKYFDIEYSKRWKLLIVRMILLKRGVLLSDRDKDILNIVIRYCNDEGVDRERITAIGEVYKPYNLWFGSVYKSEFDSVLFILLSSFEKANDDYFEYRDSIYECFDYLTEIGISEKELIDEILRIVIQ